MLVFPVNSIPRCRLNSRASRVPAMPKERKELDPWQREDARRLKALWEKRDPKITQVAAAAAWQLGETQGITWQYLNGKIPLNLSAAVKFARGLNCQVADFSPILAQQLAGSAPQPAVQVGKPIAREAPLPYKPTPEVMSIPVMNARGSMGPGEETQDQDTVIDHLRLAGTWVRRHLPGASSSLNLAAITGYGDSMSPTYNDGDILLVDTGVKTVDRDGVFVLRANQRLYIKRVRQRIPDGKLEVTSDNPTAARSVDLLGKDEIDVLGKVLWAWNGKRL